MSAFMYAEMGMSALGTLGKMSAARTQYKMERSAQRHRNAVLAVQSAQQLNRVNVNAARIVRNNQIVDVNMQTAGLEDLASAEVSAAAAGAGGGSVRAVMQNVTRSALVAQAARKKSFQQEMLNISYEQQDIRMGAEMNRDISVLPKPSIGLGLLQGGARLLDVYDAHRPEGERHGLLKGWI